MGWQGAVKSVRGAFVYTIKTVAVRQFCLGLVLLVLSGCAIPRPGPAEKIINAESADLAGFMLETSQLGTL